MPTVTDRCILTLLSLVLSAPFFILFSSILLWEPRTVSETAVDVTVEHPRDPAAPGGATAQNDDAGPVAHGYVVTWVRWTPLWPVLGRFGNLGSHVGLARVGLACIFLAQVITLVCIWRPTQSG